MYKQDNRKTKKHFRFKQSSGTSNEIKNEFFKGKHKKNTSYLELSPPAKSFILWLLSYSLNFETKKIDYYFRLAKRVQELFHVPGWILLMPYTSGYTKRYLKNKIKEQMLEFNKELQYNNISISSIQAHALNKIYRNFIWE